MSGFVSTEIRLDRNNLLESTLSDPGEVGDIFKLGYTYYRIVRKYRYAELVNHAIVENVSYLDYVIKQYPHILSRKHPFFDKIKSIEHNPDISWACPKEWFLEYTTLPFEGIQVKVPKDYDSVLRDTYGDYMQLPPERERHPYHGYRLYRKED